MSTIIGSIIVFMLVITIHELGHFLVAKFVGIKVNEFSIGMGPKIYSKNSKETKYSLRILPVGGYVAMEGEEESSNDPRSFNNVSVYKRMAVVVAGAFMNFVLAIIAFFIIALFIGSTTNTVGRVLKDSPAYVANIRANDTIIEINDFKIKTWDDIINAFSTTKKDENINIKLVRNGSIIEKNIKADFKDGRNQIGIASKVNKSLISSIRFGFTKTFDVVKQVFFVLGMLFKGDIGLTMLSGPVGVISEIGKATSHGIINLFSILGLISANLGVVNLLPFPALDGGKFVFLLYEAITNKKVNEKFESYISIVGISLLFSLMIYVTIFGDLTRLNIFK